MKEDRVALQCASDEAYTPTLQYYCCANAHYNCTDVHSAPMAHSLFGGEDEGAPAAVVLVEDLPDLPEELRLRGKG